jgi:hypothetical protein
MRWSVGLVLLMLALPGCAAFKAVGAVETVSITQEQVYELKASYATIQTGMAGYRQLPWCSKSAAPCQTGPVALQMQKADVVARSALAQVESVEKAGSSADLLKAYKVATAAVDAVQVLVAQYGSGT